jgi:capsular polysaccharide transport system permease protein
MSRDAVHKLETHDNLRAVLDRPGGDFVTRFPGILFWRHDFEALYASYKHFVSVDTNTETGITTLEVKAYRAQDAQAIAKALLLYSEDLVNNMNVRAREDTLKTFEQEVKTDEQSLARVQDELTAYRVKHDMLDPKTAAVGPLGVQTQFNTALANARSQLVELNVDSPHSPQIPLVRTRIAALEKMLHEQRAKISGDTDSVVATLSGYERLNIDQQIDVRALASAFSSLESARLEAQRQQLYIEEITQPNLADYPLYPKRVYSFVMVLSTCLLTYGIAWLLVASVREHQAA